MGERCVFADDGSLYERSAELVRLASEAGVTLGTAESCTGGLVASCLTAVPGSSQVVLGGVVSYALAVKRAVLGVAGAVLDAPGVGAVSSECAEQMAQGARRALGCDVAVSVTGIAGPGGAEPGKPVGTVWMGLARAGAVRSRLFCFPGDRAQVRRLAAEAALALLREGVVEVSSRS